MSDRVTAALSTASPRVARILGGVLDGGELARDEAAALLESRGRDLTATVLAADAMRRREVGDVVTYVVNRNINFTNVCIKRCGFCAFSRDYRREDESYFLPVEEILARAREAWELGATEVCVQAGLPPQMEGGLYIELTRAIKEALPDIHVHGFSPEEVLYGAVRSRCTLRDYLMALKDAGVGSLPGTSAEILVQEIRDAIAPGRITVDQWVEVITTAHELGIPTTATIMYGHVESAAHRAQHLDRIRSIQKATGGFTEFVPLSFVHSEAPMSAWALPELRRGPSREETLSMHAVARLFFAGHIDNLQVSWVKEGREFSRTLLDAGVNDLGGTLINESISTAAGASHGQRLSPRDLRALAREAGRTPAERTTSYRLRRVYDGSLEESAEPLDVAVAEGDGRFGSYRELVERRDHRFRHPKSRERKRVS